MDNVSSCYPMYCINLKERTDRKEDVKRQFKKINIEPNDVIFLDFYKHKKGGIYGCYDSHMKVWNDFYNNHTDKELCIVFEDDIEATKNSILYLKRAISFIKKNKDKVDILFLHDRLFEYNDGHDGDDSDDWYDGADDKNLMINNKYFTRGYGFLTHAYIITRKYIKSVIDKNNHHLPKPNGMHVDIEINLNKKSILYSENLYFCKYPIFIQKNLSISDNYNNIIDEIIKKKYGNNYMFDFIMKIGTNIRLLTKNDEKTKKIAMLIHNLYVLKTKKIFR